MSIPPLNLEGLLPLGIHDASLEDIRQRFGSFQTSDLRPRLFDRLVGMANAFRRITLFDLLLIDGSFVTANPTPNDIDLIAVLKRGHDFERDLPISEYALVSRTMLARRFRFDVIIAEEGSHCITYISTSSVACVSRRS